MYGQTTTVISLDHGSKFCCSTLQARVLKQHWKLPLWIDRSVHGTQPMVGPLTQAVLGSARASAAFLCDCRRTVEKQRESRYQYSSRPSMPCHLTLVQNAIMSQVSCLVLIHPFTNTHITFAVWRALVKILLVSHRESCENVTNPLFKPLTAISRLLGLANSVVGAR